MRRFLLIIILGCTHFCAHAQWGVGFGNLFGMPFYADKEGYYSTPTLGADIHASYRPPYRHTYPSVHAGICVMQVPIHNAYLNNVNLNCIATSARMCLNYKPNEEAGGFSFRWGLGVSHIKPDISDLSLGPDDYTIRYLNITDKGNNNVHPTMEIGLTYLWRLYNDKPFFLGINIQTQYIYMFDNDRYSLNTLSGSYSASMSGHLLFPAFGAQLVYVFGDDYF